MLNAADIVEHGIKNQESYEAKECNYSYGSAKPTGVGVLVVQTYSFDPPLWWYAAKYNYGKQLKQNIKINVLQS